jgi:hypothetical protein
MQKRLNGACHGQFRTGGVYVSGCLACFVKRDELQSLDHRLQGGVNRIAETLS